jgi:hypothetical protein
MLFLDDETLPILNKPKHPSSPQKWKKQRTKWKGLRFDVSSLQGEPTKYYWQPKQQSYIDRWLHG